MEKFVFFRPGQERLRTRASALLSYILSLSLRAIPLSLLFSLLLRETLSEYYTPRRLDAIVYQSRAGVFIAVVHAADFLLTKAKVEGVVSKC